MTSARKALFLAVTAATLLGLSTTTAAVTEDSFQQSEVNITVDGTTAVDLHPESLQYSDTAVGATDTTSDRGFDRVTLENVGSEYINTIWVNATRPTSDPFDANDVTAAEDFDAGNFFLLRPASSSTDLLNGDFNAFNFVNRIEFATYSDAEVPSYVDAPRDEGYNASTGGTVSSSTVVNVSVGTIKAGDQEYYFALPVGTNNQCNGDGAVNTLLVAKQAHTAEDTSPVSFSADDGGFPDISGFDYNVYNISPVTGSSWGVTDSPVNLSVDSNQRNYHFVTNCQDAGGSGSSPSGEAKVIRTRYNVQASGADDLDDQAGFVTDLMNTSTQSDMLAPNEFVEFDVGVQIPRGIPEGEISPGKLTVLVTSDTDVADDDGSPFSP